MRGFEEYGKEDWVRKGYSVEGELFLFTLGLNILGTPNPDLYNGELL